MLLHEPLEYAIAREKLFVLAQLGLKQCFLLEFMGPFYEVHAF
jgi:hypothetical protein